MVFWLIWNRDVGTFLEDHLRLPPFSPFSLEQLLSVAAARLASLLGMLQVGFTSFLLLSLVLHRSDFRIANFGLKLRQIDASANRSINAWRNLATARSLRRVAAPGRCAGRLRPAKIQKSRQAGFEPAQKCDCTNASVACENNHFAFCLPGQKP